MPRFDNTTTWFEQSENAQHMAETDQHSLPQKKNRWPAILMAVCGVTVMAFCVLVVIARKLAPAPQPPAPPPVASMVPAPAPKAEPEQKVVTPAAQPEAAPVATEQPATEQAAPATAPEPVAPAPPAKKLSKKEKARLARLARLQAKNAAPATAPVSAEVLRGEKLLAQHKTAAALREFQKQIAHNPRDTRALKDACTALKGLGRVNDAARVCRHALTLQPDDLETRSRLATIYYSGGAYQWAANEWRRVLAAQPDNTEARRGLQKAQARL
jgi:tetratricopeptide (TPR) repeat protein